jgi:hypothetical protein
LPSDEAVSGFRPKWFVRGDVDGFFGLFVDKRLQTVQLIEQLGAEVHFLPPYSPDLNPIEKMWSKVKQSLRSAEHAPNRLSWKPLVMPFETLRPNDAKNWLVSCGYSFI